MEVKARGTMIGMQDYPCLDQRLKTEGRHLVHRVSPILNMAGKPSVSNCKPGDA